MNAAAFILATAPAHQRPRNRQHLYALRAHARIAPQLVEAFLGEDDGLVGPVTKAAEDVCEGIRTVYAMSRGPSDVPDVEARRLLEISDLCWRVLQVARKLKACPPPKRRESRAITEERERWARRLHETLIELRGLL